MLNGASIPVGATFAPTGGTATSLKTKKMVGNAHVLYLDEGNPLSAQTTFGAISREPTANSGSPGGYTQARSLITIVVPVTLADGSVSSRTLKIEQSVPRETAAADKASLRELGMHVLSDADFTEFWDEQSQA